MKYHNIFFFLSQSTAPGEILESVRIVKNVDKFDSGLLCNYYRKHKSFREEAPTRQEYDKKTSEPLRLLFSNSLYVGILWCRLLCCLLFEVLNKTLNETGFGSDFIKRKFMLSLLGNSYINMSETGFGS